MPLTGIAFDNADAGDFTGTTSVTYSHTCTGVDRFLVVTARVGVANNFISATYNGVPMILAGAPIGGGATPRVGLWYLVNPAAGANNVVVTANAAVSLTSRAISYTGAKAFENVANNNNVGTNTLTVSPVTVAVNSWAVGVITNDIDSNPTAGAGTIYRGGAVVFGLQFLDSNGPVSTPGARALISNWVGLGGSNAISLTFSPVAAWFQGHDDVALPRHNQQVIKGF